MDWDQHLHTILFAYKTTFKVGTCHIPFQLVYGLHALKFAKYLLPMTNSAMFHNIAMTLVFNNRLSKLKKLEESQTPVA
jgi:hypothetical protein